MIFEKADSQKGVCTGERADVQGALAARPRARSPPVPAHSPPVPARAARPPYQRSPPEQRLTQPSLTAKWGAKTFNSHVLIVYYYRNW